MHIPPKELIRKLLIVNNVHHLHHQFSLPRKLFLNLNSFILLIKFCVYHRLQTDSGAQVIYAFFNIYLKIKTVVLTSLLA